MERMGTETGNRTSWRGGGVFPAGNRNSMNYPLIYLLISILFALVDTLLAVASIRRRQHMSMYVAGIAVSATMVNLFYLASVFAGTERLFSAASSFYFLSIDVMVVFLFCGVLTYAEWNMGPRLRRTLRVLHAYTLLETFIYVINIFYPFAISYERIPGVTYGAFRYVMHPVYYLHLVFTYGLVVLTVAVLLYKTVTVPREYRHPFILLIVGIAAIVVLNGIFLYLPGDSVYTRFDFSILGYSIPLFLLYWCLFVYTSGQLVTKFKDYAFNNISQGVVLFDYTGKLVLCNHRAAELLPEADLARGTAVAHFLKTAGISLPDGLQGQDGAGFRCYPANDGEMHPVRCDYSVMRNRRGQLLGRLFAFTDEGKELDPLTGFRRYKNFLQFCENGGSRVQSMKTIGAMDINGLKRINRSEGSDAGDREILALANAMRRIFPVGTEFVRGPEASLLVISKDLEQPAMRALLEATAREYSGRTEQAVAVIHDGAAVDAATEAIHAMQLKKMLDKDAVRSETLTSLIRALQQSDVDTEGHVRRTRTMGDELALRFGLSDEMRGELSLLCLLHDIGKIGIPLEILNKPGPLSESEWQVMKSHTQKGYKIAMSSPDTACIADAVLHHHERWDGRGYPDGIAGEDIPLLSRFISVVDAYDAMVVNRVYRPAMHPEDALRELERCAGSQFDPHVVREFIAMVRSQPERFAVDLFGTAEIRENATGRFKEQTGNQHSGFSHKVRYTRYILDPEMNIVSVDKKFERITGYSAEDVIRNHMSQTDLLPKEERADYLLMVNKQLAKHSVAYVEHRLCRKDGRTVYVLCFGRNYYDSAEQDYRSEVICVDCADTYTVQLMCGGNGGHRRFDGDAAEEPEAEESLLALADFAGRVDALLESSGHVVLMTLKPDAVSGNTEYRARQLIIRSLCGSLREEDPAGRMDGDVYMAAVGFAEDVGEATILERARQVFDRINMRLQVAGEAESVSMGIAVATRGDSFATMAPRAATALQHAMEEGRGRFGIG